MKPGLKKRWIESLESGDFAKGTHALCRVKDGNASYCCLGVLTELVEGEDVWVQYPGQDFLMAENYKHVKTHGFPPDSAILKYGLSKNLASVLANTNDRSEDFLQVIKIIKEFL